MLGRQDMEIDGWHIIFIVAIICWTGYYAYKRKREYDAGTYNKKGKRDLT